ncbi:MaoC family dehydratase [Nocardia cyriacigeorgica]|uniref:MaoC family dehydratase n=1 Tax=Nocardia cyriacigeorgica TaxID=135487 RepID=UPI002453B7A6|nr:MaoC family dehydratase [Nocardia cyriacigeorgica]
MTATTPAPVSFGPLTEADFARYQDATRDPGLTPDSASGATEFTTASGPLSAALLASYATDWLGADTVRRFRTRCARPLWPGDTLTCSGYVVQQYVLDGETCVDITLVGTDQDGRVAARAWATFVCE